jgi:hypothetical protein
VIRSACKVGYGYHLVGSTPQNNRNWVVALSYLFCLILQLVNNFWISQSWDNY